MIGEHRQPEPCGFSNESIVQSLAEDTKRSGEPRVILPMNDYDPSGSIMLADILKRARHYAPEARFYSEQVTLTRDQVTAYGLPTRPTKRVGNSHAASFTDPDSVELDAMDAEALRSLLRAAIERHVDQHEMATMQAVEDSERASLAALARRA